MGCGFEVAPTKSRPGELCGFCNGWVTPRRTAPKTPDASRARRNSAQFSGGKGQACAHAVAKCFDCRGPHTAQSDLCPKKEAGQVAKGLPPPAVPQQVENVEYMGKEVEELSLHAAERGYRGGRE